ncbi:Ras and EF-hand domain-containing protein like [Schistosoma japonicum]|nr:Ras and EF-hand domain-containing protein like [Schistosoma japonicum]
MYETILVDIVQYIQKSREIQYRLEKQIESERLKHSETIFRLSEEVDNQVKLAEESARIKEREIAMKKFSTEIETKSMQIKQLKSRIKYLEEQEVHHKESYSQHVIHKSDEQNDSSLLKLQTKISQISQENYNLEEQLNTARLQLAQSHSEFNGVRQSLSDKNYELEQHMTALIETIKENSALKRQNGIYQDINRKLYDANDDLYNMFENYPEWLRKDWKVEDINPVSSLIDPRFQRTPTEFKPIKSVVKAFNNNEANSSTYISCKNDLTGGLKPTTSGRNYCVKSKCDHLHCFDSKGNHRNLTQFTEQFESHNNLYSTSSMNLNNSNCQSFNYQLSHHINEQNEKNKFDSLKKLHRKHSIIKSIYSTNNVINEKLRIFRIMLAGDSSVGKTSLLIRICDDVFTSCSITTIGVDMKMRSVEIDGKKTMLQIWDTAGQERFRSVSTSFYRKADGILLVYDCTSEFSFISTRDWITIIEENAAKQIPIAIVGNKKDLKEQKEWQGNKCVSYATGSKLAQEIGALFFETSALTGENVNECVEALVRLLCAQEDYNLRCPQLQVLNDTPRQSNGKCCVR